MRPGLRIVVYAPDVARAECVRFVLRSKRASCGRASHSVASASTMEDLTFELGGYRAGACDVGVVFGCANEAAVRAMLDAGVRQVLLQPDRMEPGEVITGAHRVLAPNAGMAELVEAVRVQGARHRGPKKRLPVLEVAALGETAVAGGVR